MEPKKRVIEKPFQKGNKGGGRKPLPPDVKHARAMAYEDMCRTVIKIRSMKEAEAVKHAKLNLTLGERVILTAYLKKDDKLIKQYEDRLFGKATENITLQSDIENPLSMQIVIKGLDDNIFKNNRNIT